MRWIVASVAVVGLCWWWTSEEPEAFEPAQTGAARTDAAQTDSLDMVDGKDFPAPTGIVTASNSLLTEDPAPPSAGGDTVDEYSDDVQDASVDASPAVAFAIAENARRTVAYDSYDDELLSFYRYELDLTDEDLEIIADATKRMAAQTSGQVVPGPEDGEFYARYQGVWARYRAEVRAHLGDDRFHKIVEFQRTFTTAAPDRFGVENGVPFERF